MAKSTSSSKSKASKASKTTAKAAKPSTNKSTAGGGSKKEAIFRFVCEQHAMGITEIDKMDICLGVGNQNPRSEGFAKPLKELSTVDGIFAKGSKKDSISLTPKGIKNIPKDLEVSNDPAQRQNRYIEFIENKVKGSGKDKVRPLFNILNDRQPHSIKEIAKDLGYSNHRSFGNTKIIPAMKDMNLVEDAGKGVVQLSGKVPVV